MTSRACCVLLAAFVGLIHTSGASLAEEPPREPWTASTTVGEVVARRPATARIFELVGIDYCCGGETTLTAAAEAAGVDPIRLLAALAVVGQGDSSTAEADWTRKSSREIVQHVLDTHHVYLRGELPRIARMAGGEVLASHAQPAADPDFDRVGLGEHAPGLRGGVRPAGRGAVVRTEHGYA